MVRGGGSIGHLQHRVIWKEPARTAGVTGQQKVTGSLDQVSTWAEVIPVGSFEKFGHAQQFAESTHGIRFRLLSVPDVKFDWTVIWGTRVFQILGLVLATDRETFSFAELAERLPSTG